MNNARRFFGGLLLALLVVFVAACAQRPAATSNTAESSTDTVVVADDTFTKNAAGFADITAQQLSDLLSEDNVTLVNVHLPYAGEIPQTDLFIRFDQVGENTDMLPAKDAPIVLYCRSGSMSTQAATTLASLGYTNVLEVDGGMNAWQAADFDLLQKQ